jgi:hypothetical protein
MQQRGIPEVIINCLIEVGARIYDHHGCRIRYFDGASWRRLERNKGKDFTRKHDRFRDAYVVEKLDGVLLTVGHKYRRIHRN